MARDSDIGPIRTGDGGWGKINDKKTLTDMST